MSSGSNELLSWCRFGWTGVWFELGVGVGLGVGNVAFLWGVGTACPALGIGNRGPSLNGWLASVVVGTGCGYGSGGGLG